MGTKAQASGGVFAEWPGWSDGPGSGRRAPWGEGRGWQTGPIAQALASLVKESGLRFVGKKEAATASGQGSDTLCIARSLGQKRAVEPVGESGKIPDLHRPGPQGGPGPGGAGRHIGGRGTGLSPYVGQLRQSSSLLCVGFSLCELGDLTPAPGAISRHSER